MVFTQNLWVVVGVFYMILNKEDKIAKILTDELCYCYCDNCEFGNWDKY